MQRLRLISMFSAFLIVLLHSFVPHAHHSELSIEEHKKAHQEVTGIIDFLSLAFHFDHGDGQLQEFTSDEADSHTSDFETENFALILADHPLSIPAFEETPKKFAITCFRTGKPIVRKHSLRGPPSLS